MTRTLNVRDKANLVRAIIRANQVFLGPLYELAWSGDKNAMEVILELAQLEDINDDDVSYYLK